MAWNGPPVLVPGLGSQVSSWLTPPASQIIRTRFCCLIEGAAAKAGLTNESRAERPQRPAAAPARKSRRESACSAEPQA